MQFIFLGWMMFDYLERTALIYSQDILDGFAQSHVLVAGLGGVGGYVADSLVRSGVGKLTIIDHDIVSRSNINRQLIALNSTIGQKKITVLEQRLRDINPSVQVNALDEFIRKDDTDALLAKYQPDIVVDAIDSLACKVALVAQAYEKGIPVFSSMGAGRKKDVSKVRVGDISKTEVCALARHMRKRLKKHGITQGIQTVYSVENPIETGELEMIECGRDRVVNGSISYMPALFGLMLSGLVLDHLAQTNV